MPLNPLQFWTVNNMLITGVIGLLLVGVLVLRWLIQKRKSPDTGATVTATVEPILAAGETVLPPPEVKKEGKYPALIIPITGPWYFGKIPDPIGHMFVCDTTMPETGEHYLVKEIKDGEYEAYDPRTAPIASTTTPELAYRKTQDWEDDIPYVDDTSLMEKLPAIAAYALIGITGLAILIFLGK